MLAKQEIFPPKELNEAQQKQLQLVETALDAILQINGSAAISLKCLSDPDLRAELNRRYQDGSWTVLFVEVTNCGYNPPRSEMTIEIWP